MKIPWKKSKYGAMRRGQNAPETAPLAGMEQEVREERTGPKPDVEQFVTKTAREQRFARDIEKEARLNRVAQRAYFVVVLAVVVYAGHSGYSAWINREFVPAAFTPSTPEIDSNLEENLDASGNLKLVLKSKDAKPIVLGPSVNPPQSKPVVDMSQEELRGVIVAQDRDFPALLDAYQRLQKDDVQDIAAVGAVALKHRSYIFRQLVIQAMQESDSQKVIPALALGLGDSDLSVRLQAVEALGSIGGESALAVLGDHLKREKEEVVLSATRDSIERINGYSMESS